VRREGGNGGLKSVWERSRIKRRRGVEDGDRRAAWRRGGRLLDGSIQDGSVENRNRAWKWKKVTARVGLGGQASS
jgi:hypothetical protein